jgi:DNA-binding transcriptional LysR family regulator
MRVADVDLKDLALAVAVAETGTLTGAARHLDLSVSALSHRLAHLERRLGTALFVRAGGGMTATPAGAQFCRHARDALAAAARAARVTVPADAPRRVGSAWIMATTVLPPLLAGLGQGPALAVRTGRSEQVLDWVERELVEVGLVRASSERAGVTLRAVGADPAVLTVTAGHPWTRRAPTVAEVMAEPFVAVAPDTGYGRFLADWARGSGFDPPTAVVVDHLEAALALVAAGVAPALLPRSLAAPRTGQGGVALVDVPDLPLPRRTLAVAWPEGRTLPPWARDWPQRLTRWLATAPPGPVSRRSDP